MTSSTVVIQKHYEALEEQFETIQGLLREFRRAHGLKKREDVTS